jgi:hypothetical protein
MSEMFKAPFFLYYDVYYDVAEGTGDFDLI